MKLDALLSTRHGMRMVGHKYYYRKESIEAIVEVALIYVPLEGHARRAREGQR